MRWKEKLRDLLVLFDNGGGPKITHNKTEAAGCIKSYLCHDLPPGQTLDMPGV